MKRRLFFLTLLFSAILLGPACQKQLLKGPAERESEVASAAPEITLIYIIHGDDSYLYHTAEGTARRADEEALQQAKAVGRQMKNAAVYIFHQKPRKKFLFFFPKKDGKFYHFRHGRFIAEQSYSRKEAPGSFSAEAALLDQFRGATSGPSAKRFLFFFGHQISETPGAPYHKSYPHAVFTIQEFAAGLLSLAGPSTGSKPFDIITLSTCNNGTPGVIAALTPLTGVVLASPGNLHLSYLDTRVLSTLNLRETEAPEIARMLAKTSFEQLKSRTHTAITLAVYHTDRLLPQIRSLAEAQHNLLASMAGKPDDRLECFDCAEKDLFPPGALPGVETFYHPSRFGRTKHRKTHSGLACWRLKHRTEVSLSGTRNSGNK